MTKKKIDFEEVANNLAQELAEANEALLRERADAANVRRRAEEDRVKLGSFYKAYVVKELLPFLDNFDRALKHMPEAVTSHDSQVTSEEDSQLETRDSRLVDWIKGIESINKQLATALEKIGVERIKTVGEKFDPKLHEAVTMEEGEGTEEIVSEELQSGYKIGDEVIRHAMVRVKLQ